MFQDNPRSSNNDCTRSAVPPVRENLPESGLPPVSLGETMQKLLVLTPFLISK